jgi:formamidopyrimidine-DNA glycosylase
MAPGGTPPPDARPSDAHSSMPELPEVQTIVNDLLAAGLVGTRVSRVRLLWPGSVATPSPRLLPSRLQGRGIAHIRRRGKFIVFELDDRSALLLHLRMTGRLQIAARGQPRGRHERVALELEDGRRLQFHDTRKFGRFYLLDDPQAMLARLGPEPLDRGFTSRRLAGCLRSRKRQLKPLLLDQTVVAGLGNIYVDEALWDSRLHPLRSGASLSDPEIRALHRAIRQVLRRGLANQGTTLGSGETTFYSVGRRRGRNRDALRVFRRTGAACPRCGTAIERIVVAQRSTHLCPRCQAPGT